MSEATTLENARSEFIAQWGVFGSRWGINRTMAQIHALLMTSPEPLTTDQVMEQLQISRGNAHSNLRELEQWQLVRSVIKKGERKEFFEAEKDVSRMFNTIVRQRKAREFDPALETLRTCRDRTAGLKSPEARAFNKQIAELTAFVEKAGAVLDRIGRFSHTRVFNLLLRSMK